MVSLLSSLSVATLVNVIIVSAVVFFAFVVMGMFLFYDIHQSQDANVNNLFFFPKISKSLTWIFIILRLQQLIDMQIGKIFGMDVF